MAEITAEEALRCARMNNMASKLEILQARVRETPLRERLEMARTMIGKMCSEGRPPKMTIPVEYYDEDFFISTTLGDALSLVDGQGEDKWRLGVAPCPWCGAVAESEDEWGALIIHKAMCYWLNIHGDSIGRVRVNNSEKERWNRRSAASVTTNAAALHWRLRAGVAQTMCGLNLEQAGVSTTLLGDQATCERCKVAFVGYKFGRADAAPDAGETPALPVDAAALFDELRKELAFVTGQCHHYAEHRGNVSTCDQCAQMRALLKRAEVASKTLKVSVDAAAVKRALIDRAKKMHDQWDTDADEYYREHKSTYLMAKRDAANEIIKALSSVEVATESIAVAPVESEQAK